MMMGWNGIFPARTYNPPVTVHRYGSSQVISIVRMVSVSIKAPGKPATQVDFPGKTAEQVTVLDLKKAIRARGIKVSLFGFARHSLDT
jgi:hypothetical protein